MDVKQPTINNVCGYIKHCQLRAHSLKVCIKFVLLTRSEKESERDTDRQTETERLRDRDRQTETERLRDGQTDRQ